MIVRKELYFDSLSDFWDFAFQESYAKNKTSRSSYNLNWSGALNWNQAKQMALSGWKEGMRKVDQYRVSFLPRITERVLRPHQVYSMTGYQVDVGSYLANQPENFIDRVYEERNYPGKIYRLVSSISFSSSINPDTIIQRGAMLCALVDAIEYAGHRVEVICNDASCNDDSEESRNGKRKSVGWFEVSVCVKKSTQAVEMTDMAFCLAHPAMLRRMMFSAAELEGWSDFSQNYGYPAQATDQGDIYLKEIHSDTISDDEAIDWIINSLKELDVDIIEEKETI